jgi:hypothetical protein
LAYAKGATDDELDMFIARPNAPGLPVQRQLRQAWIAKSAGSRGTQNIDGFRLIAGTKYNGQDGPYWCGQDDSGAMCQARAIRR